MTRAVAVLCVLAAACSSRDGGRVGTASQAMQIGPTWVADPPVPAPMTGDQFGAGAGFDGSNYLVGWVDQRARYGAAIMVERVAPDGTVLDPGGREIYAELDTLLTPSQVAVGFDGASYLVVWAGYGVFAERVSTDGIPIDETPIQLSSSRRPAGAAAVAFDGTRYLVAWSSPVASSTQTDVYASRVTSLVEDLDATDLRVAHTSNSESLQGMATSGSDFLVLWHESGNFQTRGAFVGPSDGAVSASFAIGGGEIDSASAAFDGANYVLAWHRAGGIVGNPNIFARRVAPGGGFLESPVPIGVGSEVSAAFDGSNTFVTWTRAVDFLTLAIDGVRLSSDLSVLDEPALAISTVRGPWGPPVATAGAAGAVVLWRDGRFGVTGWDLFGARIAGDGTVLDPDGVSMVSGANVQRSAALAFDGSDFLAAWEDHRDRTADAYRLAIDPVSGPAAAAQPLADGPAFQGEVAIAASAAGHLVAWTEQASSPSDPDIHAARFDASGNRLDDPPLVFAASLISQEDASAAASAGGYLLAWSEWRSGARRTYAARVGLGGEVPDGSGALVDFDGETPAVASSGEGYLVASVHNTTNGRDLRLRLATQEDGVIGEAIVYPASVVQSIRPSATWNGQHYVIVWSGDSGGTASGVLAARFASDGTALDQQAIRLAPDLYAHPTIASGGRTSLVTWRDGDGVRAAWFTSTGAVVPPDGFVVAAVDPTSGWGPEPAVACDPDARCLVAFEQSAADEPRTPRVQLVRVTLVDLDGDEIDDDFDPEVTPPDAAPIDGGGRADGGGPTTDVDGGAAAADGGAGSPDDGGGCGCNAGGRRPGTLILLLLAAAAVRVRRRPSGRPRTL